MNELDRMLDSPAELWGRVCHGGFVISQDQLALVISRADMRAWMAQPALSYGTKELCRIRSAAGKVGWRPAVGTRIYYKYIKHWTRIRRTV